jgi:hypothetical protein
MKFLDLTSLTLDEFQRLIVPFEAAIQAHMAAWRLDRKPPDCSPVYRVPELSTPAPEDRPLFILAYVKTYTKASRHAC